MRSEERSYRLSTPMTSSLLGGEFTSANHLLFAATGAQTSGGLDHVKVSEDH